MKAFRSTEGAANETASSSGSPVYPQPSSAPSSSILSDDIVVRQGFLQKRTMTKRWHMRWMVLRLSGLFFYTGPSKASKHDVARGAFLFVGGGNSKPTITVEKSNKHPTKPFILKIRSSNKRQAITLAAQSEKEREAWIDSIRHCVVELSTSQSLNEFHASPARSVTGQLTVHIQEAAHLQAKDSAGKCTPFCYVCMPGEQFKTEACANTTDPKWNSSTSFQITYIPFEIHVVVYDKNTVRNDNFLGYVRIPVQDSLPQHILLEQWYPLQARKEGEVVKGGIKIGLTLHYKETDPDGGELFGKSLEEIMAREDHATLRVPNIVRDCILYTLKNGLDTLGIFRESGQSSRIEALRDLYDRGEIVDLYSHPVADENVISGLLKSFVREINPKIFSGDQALRVVEAAKTREEDLIVQELKACVREISPSYRALLHAIMHLLFSVSKNHAVNRMNAENLGIVFSQVLFEEMDTEADPMQKLMKFIKPLNTATKYFIAKYTEIFEDVPVDLLLERNVSSVSHIAKDTPIEDILSDDELFTPLSPPKEHPFEMFKSEGQSTSAKSEEEEGSGQDPEEKKSEGQEETKSE